ncbi:hypothetical protein FJ364_00075, partial [Candidatus Dependentiae bacterium]|nr:hypothetical protein [Candidatus Dependentiae bacterium]
MNRILLILLSMVRLSEQMMLNAVVHLESPSASVQVVGSQASWPGNLIMASIENEQPVIPIVNQAPIHNTSAALVEQYALLQEKEDALQAKMKKNMKRLEALVKRLNDEINHVKQEKIREENIKDSSKKERVVEKSLGLQGLVEVYNREIVDLEIGKEPLHLALKGNARIIFPKVGMVFRPDDKIIVQGKSNEIVIPAGLQFYGDIIFAEPNAVLTICVETGATMIFAPVSKKLMLTPGSVFEYKGSGHVDVASDCTWLFDKEPSAARITFSDHVLTKMIGSSALQIGGVGTIVLDQYADFTVAQNQSVKMGMHVHDYLNFIVKGLASFNLVGGENTELAFNKGAYGLSIIEKGRFYVGSGASLCLQDAARGYDSACKKLIIAHEGNINVAHNGKIILDAQHDPCMVDIVKSGICGAGYIHYKGLPYFTRIQPHGTIQRSCSLSALTRALINKQQSFSWATVFEDVSSKLWVFLPQEKSDQ